MRRISLQVCSEAYNPMTVDSAQNGFLQEAVTQKIDEAQQCHIYSPLPSGSGTACHVYVRNICECMYLEFRHFVSLAYTHTYTAFELVQKYFEMRLDSVFISVEGVFFFYENSEA